LGALKGYLPAVNAVAGTVTASIKNGELNLKTALTGLTMLNCPAYAPLTAR